MPGNELKSLGMRKVKPSGNKCAQVNANDFGFRISDFGLLM